MFWQQSQYDSRLGFSFMVLVRLGLGLRLVIGLWLGLWLWLWVRVGFRVMVGVRIRVDLTLTKTLKLNPNLLSYWECCQNMVRKKNLLPGDGAEPEATGRVDRHGRLALTVLSVRSATARSARNKIDKLAACCKFRSFVMI